MFRNYLTYQFALGFHRSCKNLALSGIPKQRIIESAERMVHHFARSIQADDRQKELRFLCVALLCLRDCKEAIDEAGPMPQELGIPYEILHQRLEQLCWDSSRIDGGQLSMIS